MSDRLDELERLNGLRERGTLSEEEFARAKANVLGADAGGGEGKGMPNWLFGLIVVIALALSIFVIKPLLRGTPETEAAANGATAESLTPDDGWSISSKQDPMSDATITTAFKTFTGRASLIEVAISCASDASITYRIASFDGDRQALAMRSNVDTDLELVIFYRIRIGAGEPIRARHERPQYSNMISISSPSDTSPGAIYNTIADEASRAEKIVFEVPVANGDEAVVIDQTASSVVNLLRPCVERRKAALSKAAAAGKGN
jgi:Short C-terminal domain